MNNDALITVDCNDNVSLVEVAHGKFVVDVKVGDVSSADYATALEELLSWYGFGAFAAQGAR